MKLLFWKRSRGVSAGVVSTFCVSSASGSCCIGTSSLLGISSAAAAGFVAGIDDDELIRFEDVYVAGRVGRGHIVRWFAECELTVASSGELASVCAVSFDRRVSVEGGAPEDNLDAGKRLRHRAVGLGIHRCELEIVL